MLRDPIRRKLNNRKGETLIETLCALVIVVLLMAALPVAISAANKSDDAAASINTTCTMQKDNKETVTVKVNGKTADVDDLDGYEDGGFYFYE